jgi:hypothetical protein
MQALPNTLRILRRGGKRALTFDHEAHDRHSDNEEFLSDLNGRKTPKMLEQPLKTLLHFETSNLNTRFVFDLLLRAFPKARISNCLASKSVMRSIPAEENPIEGSMQVGRHIRRNGR